MMNFKDIHIGVLLKQKVLDDEIEMSRICNFFKCNESEIVKMFNEQSLNSEILLKWSKLLKFDFFRIYSQHLILYSPQAKVVADKNAKKKRLLPNFKKNIYTKEIIEFILDEIKSGNMTRNEVIERYKIPKTTLYKWINKYKI